MIAAPTAAEHAAAMADYVAERKAAADALGNRGPLELNADGSLAEHIRHAFEREGFYVFEDVIDRGELETLRADVESLLARAPVSRDAEVDAAGRPAFGAGFARPTFLFTRPLGDPWGGTSLLGGRHPVRMTEPRPDGEAPDDVVFLISGMCQAMPSCLRLYGHPRLLAVAEAINGPDFVPFNDAIFVKPAGLGGSVAWHQDGVTHWDSPQWDPGIHGFNFQVQLYDCPPANCLWAVPGTHKLGKIGIKARVAANGGCERLPDAVPLYCRAGDVTIANRQLLHCSFANTSDAPRISITFGFHRRSSVLGARGALSQRGTEVYDAERIFDRSAVIQVAIDARAQRYPQEPRYHYQPFAGLEDEFRFDDATFERVIRDYNLKDLAI